MRVRLVVPPRAAWRSTSTSHQESGTTLRFRQLSARDDDFAASASEFQSSRTAAALLLTTMVETPSTLCPPPTRPRAACEQPIHVYVALSAFAGRQIEFELEYAPAVAGHAPAQRRRAARGQDSCGGSRRGIDERQQRIIRDWRSSRSTAPTDRLRQR